jgi:predicted nucleic acid-binding protein
VVILADSSAWIEWLRATESPADRRLDELLRRGELATTDVVLMEVLIGARNAPEQRRLKQLLATCRYVPVQAPGDYEAAAGLYARCRGAGETIRTSNDCLIAAVAIRTDTPVLHRDADFDAIARHAPLRTM